MKVGIPATVHRDCLIDALRKITVDCPNFDVDQWAQYDGKVLIRAGALVLRELSTTRSDKQIPTEIPEDVATSLRAYFATLTAEEFEKVKPTTFAPTVAAS